MKRQALYIDCFAGIAGDMMLGALIDLGVPESVIRDGLALVPVSDFELQTSRAARAQQPPCCCSPPYLIR